MLKSIANKKAKMLPGSAKAYASPGDSFLSTPSKSDETGYRAGETHGATRASCDLGMEWQHERQLSAVHDPRSTSLLLFRFLRRPYAHGRKFASAITVHLGKLDAGSNRCTPPSSQAFDSIRNFAIHL